MGAMFAAILANPLALIAALSPLILKSIDGNRAKIDQASKLHDAELQTANDLTTEIITATDRLLYLNKEAMFGNVFRGMNVQSITDKAISDLDQKAWVALQAESALWNSSKTSRLARIYGVFNEDTVQLFSALTREFELLENMVNAAFYMRTQSRYFIRDTEAKNGKANTVVSGDATLASIPIPTYKVGFLIELLEIDPNTLPGLAGAIHEYGSGRQTPKTRQTDFRYKYFPIYDKCQKDLLMLGALMLTQIQNEQVGALRAQRPSLPGLSYGNQPATVLQSSLPAPAATPLTDAP